MRLGCWVTAMCLGVLMLASFPLGSTPNMTKSLNFIYIGSPPYVFSINGKMDGIYIDPVEEVAAQAGVDVVWVKMAPNRAQRIMQSAQKPYCVVTQGDFHRGEAPGRWWISRSFASLGKIGLLVREKDIARISQNSSIKELTGNAEFKGGFLRISMENLYEEMGLIIDAQRHLIVETNPFEMGQLVARGRIDFILVSELGAKVHKSFYDEIEPLAFMEMQGIIQKERRINILCTEAVSKDVRARINAGITALQTKEAAQ